MYKKIIGILFCMLLITTTFSLSVMADDEENLGIEDETEDNIPDYLDITEIPEGLWIIRGFFKYLDEDNENIYLKIINARFRGIGAGLMFYHLRFPVSIKISKPFFGFLPTGSIPLIGFGICKKWDYM